VECNIVCKADGLRLTICACYSWKMALNLASTNDVVPKAEYERTSSSSSSSWWLYSPRGPWPLFQSSDLFTIGRTPRTSDQLVARPLPRHRTAQTQTKHIHTPNIHALSGIRTHDHSVRASEDSSCLRALGYRDRPRENLGEVNCTKPYVTNGGEFPFNSQLDLH
jgi:hypothetical protein